MDLQCEAARALAYIAAGSREQTQLVKEAGAVKPLIELLRSSHSTAFERAMGTLANMAGSVHIRGAQR